LEDELINGRLFWSSERDWNAFTKGNQNQSNFRYQTRIVFRF